MIRSPAPVRSLAPPALGIPHMTSVLKGERGGIALRKRTKGVEVDLELSPNHLAPVSKRHD